MPARWSGCSSRPVAIGGGYQNGRQCASLPASVCGVKDGPKPLHLRTWQCRACGAWLDRDINAAVNVAKAAGWR
ncbi:MAG TPA: zinc ribbon domain-containing protein [Streptosporangiaceae bacterium]